LLLEREVIFSEDLELIFGPRKSHTRSEELVRDIKEEERKQEESEEKIDQSENQ